MDAAETLAASPWIFALVFALAILDGLFPPVPSETVIVATAALSATTGRPDWALLAFAAAAGAFTGDNLTYAIGRAIGTTRFRWLRGRRAQHAVATATRGFERGGASVIFVARYIPVGRVAVNLTAGAVGYSRRRFVLFSLGAAVTWALYCVAIGYVAGHLFRDSPLIGMAIGIVLAIVLGLVVDRTIAAVRNSRARARSRAEQERGREEDRHATDGRQEDRVPAEDEADPVALREIEHVLSGGKRGQDHDNEQRVIVERERETSEEICR